MGSSDVSAKDLVLASQLPAHLFTDRAVRYRKHIPHLLLVGNVRFSMEGILEWEMANNVRGTAAAAVVEDIEVSAEPPVPAKRRHWPIQFASS